MVTRKRSFAIVINLETDDPDLDLSAEEDEAFEAILRSLDDSDTFPSVAYVSREGESNEWEE